jgi:hypothetical protein
MKKICTGPAQFTPYRPWSDERRAEARPHRDTRAFIDTVIGRIYVGDHVERQDNQKSGRVTGFCPNGVAVRVCVGPSRQSIWLAESVRITSRGVLAISRAQLPEVVTEAPKPVPGGFVVVEVMIDQDLCRMVGTFVTRLEANLACNKAHAIEGACRMVYEGGRRRGGVFWKPVDNATWQRAEQIADRALANSSK